VKALQLVPTIYCYDTFAEFAQDFQLGPRDLVVTNKWLYDPFVAPLDCGANVIYEEKYGAGEPSDLMVDAIRADAAAYDYDRIVALGGGTILDICKLLALKAPERTCQLFTGEAEPAKERELVCVPTTCGTGSEVTNVSVMALPELGTKKGLAADANFADAAVVIPEVMMSLPPRVFATSSIDALVHATESYLSPKASPFTQMYSVRAINLIIDGYLYMAEHDMSVEARNERMADFALAATSAGIAFGNAGCGAVHALSYALGGVFHVPHGESNYQLFTAVFKRYVEKDPAGSIAQLNALLADKLSCDVADVYDRLDDLLNRLVAKKHLREYGMTEAQIDEFTDMTIANQQRLLANEYTELTREDIRNIYRSVW